jgi:hypothetical protein
MRTLLRVLRESAPRGCEKQVELGDRVLASRTSQQMVLKALTLVRGNPLQYVSLGGLLNGGNISSAG